MKKYVVILILTLAAVPHAERYEFVSEVNLEIPDNDSTGVRDTIFIDQHIQIEDINIFVGIGRDETPWAEDVLIDLFSPLRSSVRLNGWGGNRINWYNFWYDTDRQEDGPGELEDYAGSDACGEWEMFCFDPFIDRPLYWYSWRIEVIGSPITGIAEIKSPVPSEFQFKGVYPNPFNSSVSLEYGLAEQAQVTFAIYDIQGRKIRSIGCGSMPAGYHSIVWNGANDRDKPVTSGVYFVKMTAGERIFTQRAVLLK